MAAGAAGAVGRHVREVGLLPVGEKSEFGSFNLILRVTFLRLQFLLAVAARGGGGVPPAVDGAAVDEVGLLPVGEKSEFGSFLFYFRLTFLRLRFLLAGGCLGAGLGELGESGSAGLNSSGSLVPSPFFLLPFKGSNPSESWPSGPSEAPWTRLRPPRMLPCPSEPVLRRSASVVGPGEGKKGCHFVGIRPFLPNFLTFFP